MSKEIRVMLVEDSDPVRCSMEQILRQAESIRCVRSCRSGEEAVAQIHGQAVDVVLMDINLPGINGVECTRKLLDLKPGLLVVMLTVYDNSEAIFQSLQAGACGYLHKPVQAEELIAAVGEVCAGGSPMTSGIARKVVQAFNKPLPKTTVAAKGHPGLTELSDRELQVLKCLAEGYLYKEIAEEMQLSWHTVHTHIRHIYEKLQVRSRAQAVHAFLKPR